MKDERKKCRVVSCEIFEKKEKNLKTHDECLCFFLVVQVCKKIVSSDALELHMLIREAKQHDAFYPIRIKGTENRAELMSKKDRRIISLLNFWHAAKSCSFHPLFLKAR